jgi:hypothetical protein
VSERRVVGRRRVWGDAESLTGDSLPLDWKDGRRLVATFSGDFVARKNEHELRVLRVGSASGDAEARTVAVFPSSPTCVYDAAVDDSGEFAVYEVNPDAVATVRSHDATPGQTNHGAQLRAMNAHAAQFWSTREWKE